jgi:hypothetical protein
LSAKKSLITYDINLDIRILNAIVFEPGEKIPITNLKNYIGVHSARLVDTKPDRPGKARIIEFPQYKPSGECMIELVKIKEAIDKVNEYFSK